MIDPRASHFAAARKANGGKLETGHLPMIHAALDAAGVARGVILAPAGRQSDFDRAVIGHLRREEGVRSKAYQDHLGYWTIGVGRLIDKRKGGRITPDEDAILLANDPSRCGKEWREYVLTDAEIDMLLLNDVARFVSAMADWPSWQAVGGNVARKVALLSLCFQMGASGLRGFKNSLSMVEQGRYSDAAANFMLSKWAKQTPARAKRVTDMIRTGRL